MFHKFFISIFLIAISIGWLSGFHFEWEKWEEREIREKEREKERDGGIKLCDEPYLGRMALQSHPIFLFLFPTFVFIAKLSLRVYLSAFWYFNIFIFLSFLFFGYNCESFLPFLFFLRLFVFLSLSLYGVQPSDYILAGKIIRYWHHHTTTPNTCSEGKSWNKIRSEHFHRYRRYRFHIKY